MLDDIVCPAHRGAVEPRSTLELVGLVLYCVAVLANLAGLRIARTPIVHGPYVFLFFFVAYGFTELTLFIAIANVLLLGTVGWLTSMAAFCSSSAGWLLLNAHCIVIASLLFVFFESFVARRETDKVSREAFSVAHRGLHDVPMPSLTSPWLWYHMLVPFPITPSYVRVRKNICYASIDELCNTPAQYKQFLYLDVYVDDGVGAPHTPADFHASGNAESAPALARSASTPKPVLVYVHGGGWRSGSKDHHGVTLCSHLAQRGWVCVNVNYRLRRSTSVEKGLAFPAHLLDLKRAVRWVKQNISHFGGDPRFVAAAGGSAGGHLAALLALTGESNEHVVSLQPGFETADLSLQACVSYYGVLDLVGDSGTGTITRGFHLFCKYALMRVSMSERPDLWRLASPVHQIRPSSPPFLVLHGDTDNLVPHAMASEFAEAYAQRTGRTCHNILLTHAAHAWDLIPTCRTLFSHIAAERFLRCVYADWLERADQPLASAASPAADLPAADLPLASGRPRRSRAIRK